MEVGLFLVLSLANCMEAGRQRDVDIAADRKAGGGAQFQRLHHPAQHVEFVDRLNALIALSGDAGGLVQEEEALKARLDQLRALKMEQESLEKMLSPDSPDATKMGNAGSASAGSALPPMCVQASELACNEGGGYKAGMG